MKVHDKFGNEFEVKSMLISYSINPYGNAIIRCVNQYSEDELFVITKNSDELPEQPYITMVKRLLEKKPLKYRELEKDEKYTLIEETVSRHTGITKEEIQTPIRKREIVIARQLCMFYSDFMIKDSLANIGNRFAGKDHATVLHAKKKVSEMYKNPTYNGVTEAIQNIEESLGINHLT